MMILFDDEYIYPTYVAGKEKETEERAERKAEKEQKRKQNKSLGSYMIKPVPQRLSQRSWMYPWKK